MHRRFDRLELGAGRRGEDWVLSLPLLSALSCGTEGGRGGRCWCAVLAVGAFPLSLPCSAYSRRATAFLSAATMAEEDKLNDYDFTSADAGARST